MPALSLTPGALQQSRIQVSTISTCFMFWSFKLLWLHENVGLRLHYLVRSQLHSCSNPRERRSVQQLHGPYIGPLRC